MTNRANNPYKLTQIKTANRGQILIMLYESCIKNVKKATEAINQGDKNSKGVHIVKAHDIINELTASLDHKVGGPIAVDLERLYNFMVEQLVKANIENSTEPLKGVQKVLETLLDGWKSAVQQAQREGLLRE